MESYLQFGAKVRQQRMAAGLSLEALSARCGVAASNLSEIERGLIDPRVSTAQRVAAALNGQPTKGLKMDTAAPVSPTGFMTLDQVQDELPFRGNAGDFPTYVSRLIALGLLAAVQLGGEGGPWRVSTDSLAAYMGAGAPNLQPADLSGNWYNNAGMIWRSGQMVNSLAAVMVAQSPPTLGGYKLSRLTANTSIDIPIKPSPETTAIITATLVPGPDGKPLPFKNVGELYLVNRVRMFAFQQTIAADPSMIGGFSILFRTPEDYKKITMAAGLKLFNDGKISVSKAYAAQPSDGMPIQQPASLIFTDANVMSAAGTTPQRLFSLAF